MYGQKPLVRIGFNTCLDTIFDRCLEDANMMCIMKLYKNDADTIRNESNMQLCTKPTSTLVPYLSS